MEQKRHIPFMRLHWLPFLVTLCVWSFVLTCFFAVAFLAGGALHGEPVGGAWWSWIVAAPLIGFGVALVSVFVVGLPFSCLAQRLYHKWKFPSWLSLLVSGPVFALVLLLSGNVGFAVLGGFYMGCVFSIYWLILSFRLQRLEVDHVA